MTQRGVTVRMSVRYTVPDRSSMCDVFDLVLSPSWVSFVSQAVVPYLKHSTPADRTVMDDFTPISVSSADDCVICMSSLGPPTTGRSPVVVRTEPCGHCFHAACIASWLERRSTCPTCRHPFPKQIRGSYALRAVSTALVVPPDVLAWTDAMHMNLGGIAIRTIVHVTLVEVLPSMTGTKFACELHAAWIGDYPPSAVKRRLPAPTKQHLGALHDQSAPTLNARRDAAVKRKRRREPTPPLPPRRDGRCPDPV
ncbi:hypothetical protein H310_12927 [Aphanomyces invadans]|uniref:RING-type domain-containing protein n=1 Tax=Aphanomyces invadans TaxID=157072 RepID=A0A024TG09_9STRA|nr:hypothetical protein H310_12927 [Aphanomyces invadans]ETV92914.1 hypothetical protein H310_12927 [Aphanomyces invadans]|eukprot:XP_008878435.1 hypothetical protein H310_12927 [Aphanomyces invadans]